MNATPTLQPAWVQAADRVSPVPSQCNTGGHKEYGQRHAAIYTHPRSNWEPQRAWTKSQYSRVVLDIQWLLSFSFLFTKKKAWSWSERLSSNSNEFSPEQNYSLASSSPGSTQEQFQDHQGRIYTLVRG